MTSTQMDWSDFYLICFAAGFCFSFFSFVFGGARFGRLHLPHFHGHAGGMHMPSAPVGAGPPPFAAAPPRPPAGHAATPRAAASRGGRIGASPVTSDTLTVSLAWF